MPKSHAQKFDHTFSSERTARLTLEAKIRELKADNYEVLTHSLKKDGQLFKAVVEYRLKVIEE